MTWPTPLAAAAAQGPIFLGIARAVADDVRRGRLVPGQRLPGSRALAAQLGVHRNTVLAALAELEAQGWITTQPARGTFVSDALPALPLAHRGRVLDAPGFALPPLPLARRDVPLATRGHVSLAAGIPDPR